MPRITARSRWVGSCVSALVFTAFFVTAAHAEIFVMNWSETGITRTTGTGAVATQYWPTTYSNGIGFNHTNNNVYFWGESSSDFYAINSTATAATLLWNMSTVVGQEGNVGGFAIGVDPIGRIYASAAGYAAIVRANSDGSNPAVWFSGTSTYIGLGGSLVPLANGDIVTIGWRNEYQVADLIRIPAHTGLSSSYSVIAADLNGDSNWVTVDPAGNYYVSQQSNNLIQKILPNGTVSNFISTGLDRPTGLAFDKGLNELLITNFNGPNVLRYDLSGNYQGTYGTGGYSSPYFIAAEATFVPEPSTYAMALAGLACGGYSMWRRRKRV